MEDLQKKWYVIRAIGGKEKKVKEFIESEINRLGLQDYVSQVLIPQEKYTRSATEKRSAKNEAISRAMFW